MNALQNPSLPRPLKLTVENSLTLDRAAPSRRWLYARHNIPEYWVVGLPVERIEQFWAPANEAYTQSRKVTLGERVESVTVAGLEVEAEGLA